MKEIKDYEGLYAVTEDGKVWSYRTNKWLKPSIKRGYKAVVLSTPTKTRQVYIHRLVAEAYIPNPENLECINHIDEDKLNNSVNNLEWCTWDYNNKHGSRTKRTMKPVYCIELDKVFDGVRPAARTLGISNGSVAACVNGYSKTAGGYHFKFCEE